MPVAFTSPTLGLDVMAVTLKPDGSAKRYNPTQQAGITRHVEAFAAQIQAQNWLGKGQKVERYRLNIRADFECSSLPVIFQKIFGAKQSRPDWMNGR